MYFNGPTPLEAAEELTASGLQAADEGAYADAEQDLLEALHIRLEVLGKNHSLYLASLNNLGVLYVAMTDYAPISACPLLSSSVRWE